MSTPEYEAMEREDAVKKLRQMDDEYFRSCLRVREENQEVYLDGALQELNKAGRDAIMFAIEDMIRDDDNGIKSRAIQIMRYSLESGREACEEALESTRSHYETGDDCG